MTDNAIAFLSYSRHDDERRIVTKFREALEQELRSLTGKKISIFQDRQISLGSSWKKKIDKVLSEVEFFIPMITPCYFTSCMCEYEFEKFVRIEADRGQTDRILPVYLIESPLLEEGTPPLQNSLVGVVRQLQRSDWRSYYRPYMNEHDILEALYASKLPQKIHKRMNSISANSPENVLDKKNPLEMKLRKSEETFLIPKTIYLDLRDEKKEGKYLEIDIDLLIADADTNYEDVYWPTQRKETDLAEMWKKLAERVDFSVGVTGGTLILELTNLLSEPNRRGFRRSSPSQTQMECTCRVTPSGDPKNPVWKLYQIGEEEELDPLNENFNELLAVLKINSFPCELKVSFRPRKSQIRITKFIPEEKDFRSLEIEAPRVKFLERISQNASNLAAARFQLEEVSGE